VQEVLWTQQHQLTKGGTAMVYLGIDVAKDKHDCYIVNSDGEILVDVFTIPNDQTGFNHLFKG